MVNRKLIDQICAILMVVDLILGLFFLSFLLAFTLSDGGGFILTNPLIYIVIVMLFIIPSCYVVYYLFTLKSDAEEEFIFNRESYLKVKNLTHKDSEDKNAYRFSKLYDLDNEKRGEIVFDKITSLSTFCASKRAFADPSFIIRSTS